MLECVRAYVAALLSAEEVDLLAQIRQTCKTFKTPGAW